MNETEILKQNELKANKSIAFSSLIVAGIMFVMLILNLFGVAAFTYDGAMNIIYRIVVPTLIVALIIPVCLLKTNALSKTWFSYYVLIAFVVAVAFDGFLIPQEGIIFTLCLAASTLYFKPRVTRIAFYLTTALMIVAGPLAVFLEGWEPSNYGIIENPYLACVVFHLLPRLLALVILLQISNGVSKRTERILSERIKETKLNQKVTSELSIASAIQAGVLPKEFPDSKFGEIYAIMDPAKEVGGDFYDFFAIDDKHTALVIGDASGKGVPSSLYMMKAQSLVRALSKHAKFDTAKIISEVNKSLCENNEYTMFVTCWLGIIDKESGELHFTNAGHNPPIIKHNGKYEYLNAKPGLVLGGLPEFEFKESTITLVKGDKLFLYTDGVTEAHNVRSELYGEDQLLELVSKIDASPYETISKVREEIREFSRNTEQFDDITMLMLEYRKPQSVFSKKFLADNKELENVQNFIIDSIKGDLSMKSKNELFICTEEIFVNIASYSYEGKGYAEVDVNFDNNVLTLVFKDNGVPFNPLAKDDPDTKAKADDRQIGGLGIFMVKNLMDKVYYEYVGGKNILTLVKKY